MAKYLIHIPLGLKTWEADNWRAVDSAIKEITTTTNKVDSPTTGLSVSSGKVKIDSLDKVADYLEDKLVAGAGITLTEALTGGVGSKKLTVAIGAHADLTDMPDTAGTVTDHDTRYVVQQSAAAPTVPPPYEGMLWYDTDEPEPEIFLIGDGATGVNFQIKVDGETNDGVVTWMEDEDYFQFADDVVLDETLTVTGATTLAAVTATSFNIVCSDNEVVCYENEVVTWT